MLSFAGGLSHDTLGSTVSTYWDALVMMGGALARWFTRNQAVRFTGSSLLELIHVHLYSFLFARAIIIPKTPMDS